MTNCTNYATMFWFRLYHRPNEIDRVFDWWTTIFLLIWSIKKKRKKKLRKNQRKNHDSTAERKFEKTFLALDAFNPSPSSCPETTLKWNEPRAFRFINRLHRGGNLRFSGAWKRIKQRNVDEGRATVEFSDSGAGRVHISSGRRFRIGDDPPRRGDQKRRQSKIGTGERGVDERGMGRGWEEKGEKERDPDFIFVDELGTGPTRTKYILPFSSSLSISCFTPPLPAPAVLHLFFLIFTGLSPICNQETVHPNESRAKL